MSFDREPLFEIRPNYAFPPPVSKVIDETLSPTWDELLVFEEILVYGRREDIKANPPTVIVEIYDQDKVRKRRGKVGKGAIPLAPASGRFSLMDGAALIA